MMIMLRLLEVTSAIPNPNADLDPAKISLALNATPALPILTAVLPLIR